MIVYLQKGVCSIYFTNLRCLTCLWSVTRWFLNFLKIQCWLNDVRFFISQVNDTLCKWGSNSQQYCYNIESSMLIVKIFFLFKTSFLGEDVSHYVKKPIVMRKRNRQYVIHLNDRQLLCEPSHYIINLLSFTVHWRNKRIKGSYLNQYD